MTQFIILFIITLHSSKILKENKTTLYENDLSNYMNMINITEEVDKNKEEKYNSYIPEKVEEIINKKMHIIVDDSYKSDKTLEEYDKELYWMCEPKLPILDIELLK